MKELPSIVGLSRAKIYELIKTGDFPPATELTPFRSAHRSDLVEKWIEERPFVASKKGGLSG
jgi:predicted DNA-binding transcriptional regulator AlpA